MKIGVSFQRRVMLVKQRIMHNVLLVKGLNVIAGYHS